jgi:hypothetical protein
MAQKQYGIIPHDTSQVGYGQDTPVVHRPQTENEGLVRKLFKKIMGNRKRTEKKKGFAEAGKDVKTAIEKRRERQEQARDNK